MLTLNGIKKSYGGRVLFSGLDLQINRQDRIGLVGANGSGKTTLFRLILGEETADEGGVTLQRGTSFGFLPQESAPAGEESVLELACGVSSEMADCLRILRQTDQGEAVDDHDLQEARKRYLELDGFTLQARAKQILAGLAFRQSDFERPARELSGGWIMRAHLARLLLQEPDLLMLDEPTNHLDLETLGWFQEQLKAYQGAILVISHDREFLNQIVGSIAELRSSTLYLYRGNYDEYLEQREARVAQEMAAYKNQQRQIAHLMSFVERFRAKNTKAAQAQSKLKQIERMDILEAPENTEAEIGFEFPQPERSGLKAVELKQVDFAYGDLWVYRGLDFEIQRGQRTVLVGPNGAGKSTLLKLLAGILEPCAGERKLGYNVRVGYFAQHRTEVLDVRRTVLEEALDTPQRVTEEFVRTLCGAFLFRGDDVFKKVGVLSGGEKSRLALVKILLNPPNLLLMDEPTTHLDIASTDALVAALSEFTGTLVFISHDVYFIRSLAQNVLHIQNGRLTPYAGDYQYYLEKTAAVSERAGLVASSQKKWPAAPPANAPKQPAAASSAKERKRQEAEERQARSRALQALRKEVKQLEHQIAELEVEHSRLLEELQKPESYSAPGAGLRLNREMAENAEALKERTAAWEHKATELSAAEAEGK